MVAMWSARAVMVWVAETPGMPQSGVVSVHYVALILVVAVAAIYGNLGYLGMVLDDTLHAEAKAREGQVAEAASRRTAERNAEALRQLLAQRDHLAKGRQRMLTMLAHEIRQPLHNASGALQATDTALQGLPGDQARQAIERLRRAQAVLGGVHSILDNTLAANTLLADSAPIGLQEVEVGYLVDLTLGDLTEAQRARVVVQCPADLHSLEVEPGLMRLALRNLLSNALTHGGPAARVTVRIEECDTPPTLLLSVIDDGPGAAADRLMPSEAGDTPGLPSGRGLGLMIVREVAGRHGGQLVFKPMSPRGLCASMVLPLPG
jgi:signal transduction histidine kinase